MILEQTHKVTTNLKNSTEFSVSEDSSKIFAFLSNFLYKEKERSVVTELCSNALDVHQMVGAQSKPIMVHLPTDLQKEFRVRDFGPGLSEANVIQFLTKYGSSNKGGSNDFIGGFGIGSKSPAAVSDTWTVNSHFAGEMSSYLIHINDKGIPSINKLYAKPTAETGIEVIIPTKGIREWHDAAQKVFEFYEVMPEIKGTSMKITQREFVSDADGLYKTLKSPLRGVSNPHVIMNRRAYDLTSGQYSMGKLSFTRSIFLPFDTSSLSVSLSREDLQYDSKTKDAVNQRLKDIYDHLLNEWKKELSPCTSIFDYKIKAGTFMEKYFLEHITIADFAVTLKDKFVTLVDFSNLSSFRVALDNVDRVIQIVGDTTSITLKTSRGGRGAANVSYSIAYNRNTTAPANFVMSFSARKVDMITFIERDEKTSISRVKLAVTNKSITGTAVLLDKEYFDLIPGDFTKVKASSLTKPPVVKQVKSVKIESDLYRVSGGHFERIFENNVDKTVPIVCIKFGAMNSLGSISDADAKFLREFDNQVKVVAVRDKHDIPTFAVTPEQWCRAEYVRCSANKDNIIMAAKKKVLSESSNSYGLSGIIFWIKVNYATRILDTTILGEKSRQMAEIVASPVNLTIFNEYDKLNKLAKFLNEKTFTVDVNVNSMFLNDLLAAYPMIKYATNGYMDSDRMRDIIQYIDLTGK